VTEHVEHTSARDTLARLLSAGDLIAIAPQVLAEFIHIVTEAEKRPLMMVPGLITPGQRAKHGTRTAPSQLVSFSEWKGETPPSGHMFFMAPLSVV
jgi:predicted nucleic acid-binding protein